MLYLQFEVRKLNEIRELGAGGRGHWDLQLICILFLAKDTCSNKNVRIDNSGVKSFIFTFDEYMNL